MRSRAGARALPAGKVGPIAHRADRREPPVERDQVRRRPADRDRGGGRRARDTSDGARPRDRDRPGAPGADLPALERASRRGVTAVLAWASGSSGRSWTPTAASSASRASPAGAPLSPSSCRVFPAAAAAAPPGRPDEPYTEPRLSRRFIMPFTGPEAKFDRRRRHGPPPCALAVCSPRGLSGRRRGARATRPRATARGRRPCLILLDLTMPS